MVGRGGVPPPSQDVADLYDAVDRFCQRQKSGRAPEDLAAELIYLRQISDRLEVEFAQTAAGFSATDEYDDWGSTSSINWIRHNCNMSGPTAADRVRVGEQLAALPRSVDAVIAGRIGFAHLSLLARTASALSDSETGRPFDECKLLEQARQNSVGRFWHLCLHARHADDPKGFAAEQTEATEMRALQLNACDDGSYWVGGRLDSAGGAALRTALEPLARPSGIGDNRRRERRLADALIELAIHVLDVGQVSQQAGQRPHLQVNTSLETLRALPGSPAGELEFSLPISAATVQRMACDCTITRMLLGSESVVVDVGRARRVVSASTRRALNARDRQCRWPGCDRPASWTAAHHIVHWVDGGKTNLSNLVLLCQRHHWMAHERGWQLRIAPDGRLVTLPSVSTLYPAARAPDRLTAA